MSTIVAEPDVPGIASMLAEDPLGGQREAGLAAEVYFDAFHRTDKSWYDRLVVAELDEQVVGAHQITYLNSLSGGGAIRAHRPTDLRQHPHRRPPLLRAARLRREPHGVQARAVTGAG